MMGWLIWLPIVSASVFLLVAWINLGSKSANLNRQLARTVRYRDEFDETPRASTPNDMATALPELKLVLVNRKALLKARSKKRENKQRRLLSRLKNHG
jgi:hypothetical protein